MDKIVITSAGNGSSAIFDQMLMERANKLFQLIALNLISLLTDQMRTLLEINND